MIIRKTLDDETAAKAMRSGDFPADVTTAAESVILILTQSWCPQWTFMKMSLKGLRSGPDGGGLAVITYEYDRSPIFEEFLRFKETTFGNYEVPYYRLYRNGRFVGDGNATAAGRLIQQLSKAPE